MVRQATVIMRNVAERIQRMVAADSSLGNRSSPTEHAVVVTNPEFPLVAECNLVHTVRLRGDLGVWDLHEEVEPVLAAARTPWRHVVVDPFSRPEHLGRRLEESGYAPRVRVGAVYGGSPTAEPNDAVNVRGIAEKSAWAQFSALRRAIQAADGRAGEELEQYSALARRRSLSSNVRFYLGLLDYEPVGHAGLLSVGRTGMLTDLAVRQDRRGRGIGRALIRRMVEQSRSLGHDLTCVVHDDEPRLGSLLAGMGFEPACRFTSYLRRVAVAEDAPPPMDPAPGQPS